jgi:hypothetical protein
LPVVFPYPISQAANFTYLRGGLPKKAATEVLVEKKRTKRSIHSVIQEKNC